ncbi:MAG: hypothetical protein D6758_04970 [Gammaproteobacteria bacterium]|nr:MAG: hypothetical protein D6758_04970 [Gammaproteobacteria bacterium]
MVPHVFPAIVLSLVTLLATSHTDAREVSGVTLKEQVRLAPNGPVLSLNGAGLRRTFMIVKTYVGALYLENPSDDPAQVMNSQESKRMLFHVLLNRVSARKVARALRDALVLNVTDEAYKSLKPSVEQFLSMFDGTLHEGDECYIDYLPGVGTRVTVAGVDKGIIPGEAFYRAMLAIWVGDHPVSRTLKAEILGEKTKTAQASAWQRHRDN